MINSVRIAGPAGMEWVAHPRFDGILISRLLTSQDNPYASLNVVRVPPGKEIGSHTHEGQVETVFVLTGECMLTISGEVHPFKAGQVVALPSSVPHSLQNTGNQMVELLTIFTPPQV
jgi:quercetin dioxygenase-like cupin family protein